MINRIFVDNNFRPRPRLDAKRLAIIQYTGLFHASIDIQLFCGEVPEDIFYFFDILLIRSNIFTNSTLVV